MNELINNLVTAIEACNEIVDRRIKEESIEC